MWWLAVTAAGFVVATALVIALALPATARWEAEERSGPGPRVVLPPTARGGAVLRLRRPREMFAPAVDPVLRCVS